MANIPHQRPARYKGENQIEKARTASPTHLRPSKYSSTRAYVMPSKSSPSAKNSMKPSDAARIQSTQAKAGKDTGSNSFPARVQSTATTNTSRGVVNPSGGNTTSTGTSRIPRTTTASGKTSGGAPRK